MGVTQSDNKVHEVWPPLTLLTAKTKMVLQTTTTTTTTTTTLPWAKSGQRMAK